MPGLISVTSSTVLFWFRLPAGNPKGLKDIITKLVYFCLNLYPSVNSFKDFLHATQSDSFGKCYADANLVVVILLFSYAILSRFISCMDLIRKIFILHSSSKLLPRYCCFKMLTFVLRNIWGPNVLARTETNMNYCATAIWPTHTINAYDMWPNDVLSNVLWCNLRICFYQ